MSFKSENVAKNHRLIPAIKKLYMNSFPKHERMPFYLLMKANSWGKLRLQAYTDNDVFVGFTCLVQQKDIAFILYFAVDTSTRGLGYGSKALQAIENQSNGNRIILNIESAKTNADNQDERIRRKKFYLRNGYEETNLTMNEKGEVFELLIKGGEIRKEEYLYFMKDAMGRVLFRLFGPKITES